MDLTKMIFHFRLALPLTLLILLFPSANASAGGKIFKMVDSNGAVTFTDVPLLLGPQVTRGRASAAKTTETDIAIESTETPCSTVQSGSKQFCAEEQLVSGKN